MAAFWGTSSSDSGVSADLLTAWAKAKAGVGVSAADVSADPNAPIAPVWTPGYTPGAEVLVGRAFSGKSFFDLNAKLYSDLGASGDYKRLFALHTGLSTLQALAGQLEGEGISKTLRAQTEAQFQRGLAELQQFFTQQQFEDVRLAQGDRVDTAQTTLALASTSEDYLTGLIHRGSLTDRVSGLDANAKFDIVVVSAGGTERRVAIDLSEMGAMPRSLGAVVSFINGRLSAAGASTRLETVDQTPKTTNVVLGGRTYTQKYTGLKQYALKVDVRASERVTFEPADADAALYVIGDTANGARLIKLSDTDGATGLPDWLVRPGATTDPIGAYVSTGWLATSPANLYEQTSAALVDAGDNAYETRLAEAGEAVLKLTLADGRQLSVSTAWRAGDQENWRVLDGESLEVARLNDLAERLTQLLHEQGVEAAVGLWQDGDEAGLSILNGDSVASSSLGISGRSVFFDAVDPANMVGGLREGVFARRFSAEAVAPAGDLLFGKQTFSFTTTAQTYSVTINAGEDGLSADDVASQLNEKLREKGLRAAASFEDVGGALTFRVDGLHDLIDVSATFDEDSVEVALQAPGIWASGGLPSAAAGQPFADAIRTWNAAGGSPLLTHTGALDIEIVVDTPNGPKTVNVSVSALERANDPDVAGQWSAAFQARVDAALNAAGVYVSADGGDLSTWRAAEGAGHRIQSVTINGDAVDLHAEAPPLAIGGAFAAERSFTSASAASGVSDDVAALLSDQTISITFDTIWGERTVSATLEPGDPRTLESAALRLNEALAAQGYDLGVAATALSGGGAGLRVIAGNSHTIRGAVGFDLGGQAVGTTLDPIDSQSAADNPPAALSAAERAARGAAITETAGASSAFIAPSANASAWFPGRAFDVALGDGAKVATARSVATGADGSIYVLADLSGDSATLDIKGARDVALLKYDSAGKLAYSRVLGASDSASGFALAVSADGKVAVAGAVEGGLSGAGAVRGGADSFVALYDANGEEMWTARRGASGNDQINAIAFAPDGSIIVAGKTESAIGSSLALGGADGYLRGFSASGLEMFTRQFGTGRDDAVTALAVQSDGAGGYDIVTGGVEDNRGVLRSFSYAANTGLSVGATRDIGNFYKGAINALALDGGDLYVGGEIGADRLTLGASANASVAGQEGFVARLDMDLVSTALDRSSYLGSAKDDAVRGLAVVNGAVYATGTAGGVIAGQGSSSLASGFVARLDDDGSLGWMRTFSSAGGLVTPMGLAADAGGASALDILGLPRGQVGVRDSTELTDRSALRVGDEFKIGADGRRLSTITIKEGDTLQSLVATISRAIGSSGRASIVKENGVERIKITPADGRAVRIEAGRDGRNALQGLGLIQGVVAQNIESRSALKTFGLGLNAADLLKMGSKEELASTKAELSAAISIVRQAYDTLLHPNAKEQTAEEKALEARRQAAGAAPAYYNQQLLNYQAALARLTGGS